MAYNLNYDIDRLQQSVSNNFAFNLSKVEKVFREAELFFPDQLKQDYTALMDFNKKLTTERNKLISNTIKKKKLELDIINKDRQEQNNKKESLLSFVQYTDTFRRFKQYQKDLIKIETQLMTLKKKIR